MKFFFYLLAFNFLIYEYFLSCSFCRKTRFVVLKKDTFNQECLSVVTEITKKLLLTLLPIEILFVNVANFKFFCFCN